MEPVNIKKEGLKDPKQSISSSKRMMKKVNILSPSTLADLIKNHSQTQTKMKVDYFPDRGYGLSSYIDTRRTSREIAQILPHEKRISNLIYNIDPNSESEMIFLLSKLKAQYQTATNLTLSLNMKRPNHLKILSRITLSHFKKLTSLTINSTSKTIAGFFFVLDHLRSLTNLKLSSSCGDFSSSHLQILSASLSRLIHLESLSLSFPFQSLDDSLLNSLAHALRKLVSLQALSLDLYENRDVTSQAILNLFESLKDLKSFQNLDLQLGECTVNVLDSEPLSEGLILLDPSLKNLKLRLYYNFSGSYLWKLAEALQRFPTLQELNLSLSESSLINDEDLTGFASSLQNLQSLSSLSSLSLDFDKENVFRECKLTSPVQIIGEALKSLKSLKSLQLKFPDHHFDHSSISCLFDSLRSLSGLQRLNLGLRSEKMITDEVLTALASGLQHLTTLFHLTLCLKNSNTLSTNQPVACLFSALGSLTRLRSFDLALRLFKNEAIDKMGESLSESLKNISQLTSVRFDLDTRGRAPNFEPLFKALAQLDPQTKLVFLLDDWGETNFQIASLYFQHIQDWRT